MDRSRIFSFGNNIFEIFSFSNPRRFAYRGPLYSKPVVR